MEWSGWWTLALSELLAQLDHLPVKAGWYGALNGGRPRSIPSRNYRADFGRHMAVIQDRRTLHAASKPRACSMLTSDEPTSRVITNRTTSSEASVPGCDVAVR
jgi:hypothetical protein